MGLSKRIGERIWSNYQTAYFRFMDLYAASSVTGGRTQLRRDVQSSDELVHRAACGVLAKCHKQSHEAAVESLKRMAAGLPDTAEFAVLEEELAKYGVSHDEVNLQQLFIAMDEMQAQMTAQLESIGKGYSEDADISKTYFPDRPKEQCEYDFFFNIFRDASRNTQRIELVGSQVEAHFSTSPRVDELVARLGTLSGTNDGIIHHLRGWLSSSPWQPPEQYRVTASSDNS